MPAPPTSEPSESNAPDLAASHGPERSASNGPGSEPDGPEAPASGPPEHARTDPDRAATIMSQWQQQRPDLDPSSIGVLTRVWQLSRLFSAHRRTVLERTGLDAALLDLLGTLRRSGSPYRLTTRELAEAAGVTAAAISQRLTRAEQRGWVCREPLPHRRVRVHLTEAGLAMVDEVAGTIFAADDDLLGVLDPSERQALTDALSLVLHRLSAPSGAAEPT